jgi:hypothetical protein
LHPHYEFSYAPGQIIQISNDSSKFLIRFYDFVENVIFKEEVYKLPRIKFQLDVDSIIELEKRWIGQTVVARNNISKAYELGILHLYDFNFFYNRKIFINLKIKGK